MNENLLDETNLGDVSTEAVVDIVSDVMDVGDIDVGKGNELLRIRGRLFIESDEAYDRMAVAMGRIGLTPLFRIEKSDDLVIVIRSSPDEKTGNPLFNSMYNSIPNYNVYTQTIEDYKDRKDYQGNDHKLRKEAMAKLIAQKVVDYSITHGLEPMV